jgi:signal transduction histidine kinase/ActR/RegA family two-component response regulator
VDNARDDGLRVIVYLVALAALAAGLGIVLVAGGHGLDPLLAILLLALLAAVAERGTVRLSPAVDVSISLVPMLLVAVAVGPAAAMITGAASMLGDLSRPLPRWATYTLIRAITGGLTGLVAMAVSDSLGRDLSGVVVTTVAAAAAAQLLDAAFCALTLEVRRKGGLRDVIPLLPMLATSGAAYAPIVAGLVLAYERISPWTLVLFLVPGIAAHRLLVLNQREKGLSADLALANDALRRRDAILESVSAAGRRFLEAKELDEAVGRMLAELGRAAEAERVFVHETIGGEARLRWSWPAGVDAGSAESLQLIPIDAGKQRFGTVGFAARPGGREWSAGELDGLGAGAGILGAAIERQRAEEALRTRDEQLLQAQKMEAIGRLAGGIAHDFNNMLTGIGGYADLLVASLAPDDARRSDATEIRKAADRATELTRQLLAFSRKQVLAPELLDLNAFVTDSSGLLRRLLGENVELSLQLDGRRCQVVADPGQLQQIILNLTVNARDAMPDGGRLSLKTASLGGAGTLFEIADTGHGMDAATRERIFEPFFTTKDIGKGTGLGLATVHGIVEQSGGRVEVESRPGEGSIFRVYFPVTEIEASPPLPAVVGGPSGGTETILLVEDERIVRLLAARVLRECGYTVLEAACAEDALAMSESHEGVIDLLLTDVVMPGASGLELATRMTARRLFTGVLFMSGYAEEALSLEASARAGAAFITKPFTADGLARAVREALERPHAGVRTGFAGG